MVVGIGRHNTSFHHSIQIHDLLLSPKLSKVLQTAVGLSLDSAVPSLSVLNIHYLQQIMKVLRVAVVLLSLVVLAYPRSPDNEAEGKYLQTLGLQSRLVFVCLFVCFGGGGGWGVRCYYINVAKITV